MKRIRAVGIVINGSRVLLMCRKVKGKEYFVFPGGGVEEGERIEAAAEREVSEETSVKARVGPLRYRITDETSEHYFYQCEHLSGEPELGESNERARMTEDNQYRPEWCEIAKLPNTLVYPLEVRDWLIADLKNGFDQAVRHEEIAFAARRVV